MTPDGLLRPSSSTAFDAPAASVVVPVRNAAATIGQQLDALGNQDYSGTWELIIADNGSTDGTADIALQRAAGFPVQIRIVNASESPGANHARNRGVAAARAQRVALCDADDVVSPSWLRGHVALLELVDLSAGAGNYFGGPNDPVDLDLRGHDRSWHPNGTGLAAAPGCNMAFRRDVWTTIGGFDESIRGGGDDADFAWRAQLAGFRLHHNPAAVVAIRRRGSWRALFLQQYGWASNDRRLARRYRSVLPFESIPRRVARDAVWLVSRWPRALTNRFVREVWVRTAGRSLGRVIGGIPVHRQ